MYLIHENVSIIAARPNLGVQMPRHVNVHKPTSQAPASYT